MNLSEHFTLAEMVRSPTASRLGLDNAPSAEVIAALRLLCENVLEPVRRNFGVAITPTSGYRSPAVNRACGGARTSQHVLGEAVDFTVPGVANLDVCQWMLKHLNYDQLIYEFGPGGWVHASWSARRLRNQELTARRTARGTVYLPGIVA